MPVKTPFLLLILVFSFSFVFAQGEETTIKAEVDKTSLTSDETVNYKFTVSVFASNFPGVELAKFEGFNILSQTQSSNVNLGSNGLKLTLVYACILAPKAAGKFKIGPSQVKIKDKVYNSEEFEIEVKQGKAKPQPAPGQEDPSPQETPAESEKILI